MLGARHPDVDACHVRGVAIIFSAPTCLAAVQELESLVLTDPDCRGPIEDLMVDAGDCPKGAAAAADGGSDGDAR